ncbi:MAG: hypothetical protein CBB68_05780 [Rhodospirillaceae bacterium TMED8]|nr:hypothetical protein [Magnetovibrio sp.]OUT51136.1 MAG: hypothetical protein CBB68_05780 [Rhodospirillaceae bacterium TMED8]|tara:strand:- start:8348 stop:9457 length:1110 start_codon:yes stop_codon:yes gene_type:complete
MLIDFDTSAAWTVENMQTDTGWIYYLSDSQARHMVDVIRENYSPDRSFFEYAPDDFDLGSGFHTIISAAKQAYFGRGVTLVKGLPSSELNEIEYRILTWVIGLHLGVPRPQGRMTQYISEVQAAGGIYRHAGGRGYNTNSNLDFHADGCDLVALACFNAAKAGGMSMVSSSILAWQTLLEERPDLAEVALSDFHFSRNQEQAPDEGAFYAQPLFDVEDGRLFAKWNRNRINTAQQLDGVPRLSEAQIECIDLLDDILRRPGAMFSMWLEPGDLQFINNHIVLHSRTEFEDYQEKDKKRLLYRLWLAPPFSVKLPDSWCDFFRSTQPGVVRGGIRGHNHNDTCKEFERNQARHLGMKYIPNGVGILSNQS